MEKDIHGLEALETTKQQQVKDIIMQFQDVFQNTPGVADIPAYHLDTGQATPVARKPYRPALHWNDKIEEELLTQRIIQHSDSPWSSPIMAVPKPGGAVRLCVDFRAVNQLTLPDRYPLPRIDDLIGKVSAASYLTTLDLYLSKGYHQIALTDETKPKTAFICHKGKYQYTIGFLLGSAMPLPIFRNTWI